MRVEDLILILKGLAPSLRQKYGVVSLGLFGSVARGDSDAHSDIDVVVSFAPGARYSLMMLAGVKCDVEAAVGQEIDLVVDHEQLRPAFRRSLERDFIRVA